MNKLYINVCFFKQKTAYEMRISDWSSDVCSSDLGDVDHAPVAQRLAVDRLPIFLAGKVDDHRLGIVAKVGDKRIRQRFAPPGIEILLSARRPGRAHFKPIGLHQIQRTEQAVKACQNADMVLRKIHSGFRSEENKSELQSQMRK